MRTLTYDLTLMELLREWVFTFVTLKSHPLTAFMAVDFEPLRPELLATLNTEIELTEALGEADALVGFTDEELDGRFTAIVNSLMTAVNNNRSATLYVRFLGTDRPADVAEPILSEQLERMRTWVEALGQAPTAELQAHGAALAPIIAKGDNAENTQRTANEAFQNFTEIGQRKTFVDHLNGARKLVFGKIAELVHAHPEMNLPLDFPERFFLRATRARAPTIKSEKRTIERLQTQLKRHEALLVELEARAQKSREAREQAERAEVESTVATLEKEAAEMLAKAAELKEKLLK